jgi:subtilisin family serine protease
MKLLSASCALLLAAAPLSLAQGATWPLDHLDQQTIPVDGVFAPHGDGTGVTVYVVASGIDTSHPEFATTSFAPGYVAGGMPPGDCNGIGTQVASLVAGSTLGAAPGCTLVDVKVLDCVGAGTASTVVSGLDWVGTNHSFGTPAVVLMPFGPGLDPAIEHAVKDLVDLGLPVVMPAGNGATDACIELGTLPEVIVAGAYRQSYTVSSFSNQGCCIDLFAPGEDVTVATIGGGGAMTVKSGTQFSAALTAGVAAVNLGSGWMLPAAVERQLVDDAVPYWLQGLTMGSPDLRLHAGPVAPAPVHFQANIGFATHPTARIGVHADSPVLSSATAARLTVTGAPPLTFLYFVLDVVPGTCVAKLWFTGPVATPCPALAYGAYLQTDECGKLDLPWPTALLPVTTTAWVHAGVLDGPPPWHLTNALQLQY